MVAGALVGAWLALGSRWVLAGVALGIASLFKPIALFAVIAALAMFAVELWRARRAQPEPGTAPARAHRPRPRRRAARGLPARRRGRDLGTRHVPAPRHRSIRPSADGAGDWLRRLGRAARARHRVPCLALARQRAPVRLHPRRRGHRCERRGRPEPLDHPVPGCLQPRADRCGDLRDGVDRVALPARARSPGRLGDDLDRGHRRHVARHRPVRQPRHLPLPRPDRGAGPRCGGRAAARALAATPRRRRGSTSPSWWSASLRTSRSASSRRHPDGLPGSGRLWSACTHVQDAPSDARTGGPSTAPRDPFVASESWQCPTRLARSRSPALSQHCC